jgi:hypothetical protein
MQAPIMVPGADGGISDIRDMQRPIVTVGHLLARVYGSSLNRAEFRASAIIQRSMAPRTTDVALELLRRGADAGPVLETVIGPHIDHPV